MKELFLAINDCKERYNMAVITESECNHQIISLCIEHETGDKVDGFRIEKEEN